MAILASKIYKFDQSWWSTIFIYTYIYIYVMYIFHNNFALIFQVQMRPWNFINPRHQDSKTKKHDIDIARPTNRDIKIQWHKSHDT